MYFAIVALALAQIVRHAQPATDVVDVSAAAVTIVIFLVIVVPTLVLLAIDRIATIREPSGKFRRRFRVAVFATAALLIARQMQLYVGSLSDLTDSLTSMSVLGPVIVLASIGAAIWFANTAYEGLRQFFLYMTVPAFAMLMIVGLQMIPLSPPDGYATETSTPSPDAPPVFVFIFDEFSYQVIADDDGIDEASFPNFGALAADGALLTNATTNFFHTTFAVPPMAEAVARLNDEYQVRIYGQYGFVESLVHDGCGSEYTCRGQTHLSKKHTGSLVTDLLVRTVYEATPRFVERVLDGPFGVLTDALDTSLPSVDPKGIHTFTKEQWDEFMGDVSADESPGRLHFVHILLPHTPFIYGRDGITHSPLNTSYNWGLDRGSVYQRYSEQTKYVDTLFGDFVMRLKEEGLYEESTILVTGDHGLRPHSLDTGLPIEMEQQTAQVPMIIKSPGVGPQVLDVDYQHVDFGATLFDVLGREWPIGTPGVSAFSEVRPDREKIVYVDQANERYWEYVYQSQSGEWELVRAVEGPLPLSPEFADVVSRPD